MSQIAPGSTILVSGGAGYVGSGVVHQLLEQGFKVRATTRSLSKSHLFKAKVDKEVGVGRLEVVEIQDLTQPGALDDALIGVSGFVHVASDTSFDGTLEHIVEKVVQMTQHALESLSRAPEVKSFVLTSSQIAGFISDGTPKRANSSTWFDDAELLAAKESDPIKKSLYIYAASKVAGEKALWRFVDEKKPHFRVNSVLPGMVLGKIQNPAPGNYSSASMLIEYAEGRPGYLETLFPIPSIWVSAEDNAKLHIAALLDDSVDRNRLWSGSQKYSAVTLQDAVKAARPDFKESDLSHWPKSEDIDIVIDDKASKELLLKHYGAVAEDLREAVAATLQR